MTRKSHIDATKVNYFTHQLNQPLTAITNYAQAGFQLIDQGMCDSEQLHELFEKICRETNRATIISRELDQYARDSANSVELPS